MFYQRFCPAGSGSGSDLVFGLDHLSNRDITNTTNATSGSSGSADAESVQGNSLLGEATIDLDAATASVQNQFADRQCVPTLTRATTDLLLTY